MNNEDLYRLFDRWLSHELNEAEEAEFLDVLAHSQHAEAVKNYISEKWDAAQFREYLDKENSDRLFASIWSEINPPAKVRSIPGKKWLAIAASLLAAILTVSYFMLFNKEKKTAPVSQTRTDVKAPETNRAMIILADGSTVYLDSAATGSLGMQENVKLIKLADGKIAYQGNASRIVYNTLTNPKGSQVIDMTLADGSKVWLNAGSSITFPVAFVNNERKVVVNGEAYFEVAHDAAKPFKVGKDDMEITVLGTHFNVNAYDDENDIRVTLLEGSVKVAQLTTQNTLRLKPGEQAVVTLSSPITIDHSPDLEQVMAWKNGRFLFNGMKIEQVLRQVARWYDVEIVYEGKLNDIFYAEIPRNTMVSDVLKALELTGKLHFRIEGKRIIVTP